PPSGDGNGGAIGDPNGFATAGPTGFTNSTTATWSFAANEPVTFTCRLDNGPEASPCNSPKTYTGLTEGPHTFTIYATDSAGNVDTTAPTTTSNAPSGYINTGTTVTLTATDSGGSNLATTEYQLNNGGWTTGTTVTIPATQGAYVINYKSTDNAGNTETTKT